MPTTLKDIATELNLSINTVSRALRNMPDISQDTTNLVKETAIRLGYRKNLAARYLKTNKSMTFGIVVTDICNPVFSSMYKGIEKICTETNYILMLGNSNENADEENAIISNMLAHGVDGIFLVPSMRNTNVLLQLENANIPFIILQRQFSNSSANQVQSNDFEGGYLAAKHLYQLGHRSFLYVSAAMHISSAQERYNGFLTFLKENCLNADSVQVLTCAGTRSDSYKIVKDWIKQHPSTKKLSATAIFCFSDYVAYGVYSALAEYNIQIPTDISVIGYDNNEYSDMTLPPLTTVDICPYEIGEQAAKIMFELIDSSNKNGQPSKVVIPPKLIHRASTAEPNPLKDGKNKAAVT